MKTDVVFSKNSDEWETPQEFFNALDAEFHFDLDVCATKQNRKCLRYFTQKDDALTRPWDGNVWCNPPYSNITAFVKKARREVQNGAAEVVVMLVPSRTDTRWFHDHIYNEPNVEIRFVKGRLKFGGAKYNAPFPSMVVIIRKENGEAA